MKTFLIISLTLVTSFAFGYESNLQEFKSLMKIEEHAPQNKSPWAYLHHTRLNEQVNLDLIVAKEQLQILINKSTTSGWYWDNHEWTIYQESFSFDPNEMFKGWYNWSSIMKNGSQQWVQQIQDSLATLMSTADELIGINFLDYVQDRIYMDSFLDTFFNWRTVAVKIYWATSDDVVDGSLLVGLLSNDDGSYTLVSYIVFDD